MPCLAFHTVRGGAVLSFANARAVLQMLQTNGSFAFDLIAFARPPPSPTFQPERSGSEIRRHQSVEARASPGVGLAGHLADAIAIAIKSLQEPGFGL